LGSAVLWSDPSWSVAAVSVPTRGESKHGDVRELAPAKG